MNQNSHNLSAKDVEATLHTRSTLTSSTTNMPLKLRLGNKLYNFLCTAIVYGIFWGLMNWDAGIPLFKEMGITPRDCYLSLILVHLAYLTVCIYKDKLKDVWNLRRQYAVKKYNTLGYSMTLVGTCIPLLVMWLIQVMGYPKRYIPIALLLLVGWYITQRLIAGKRPFSVCYQKTWYYFNEHSPYTQYIQKLMYGYAAIEGPKLKNNAYLFPEGVAYRVDESPVMVNQLEAPPFMMLFDGVAPACMCKSICAYVKVIPMTTQKQVEDFEEGIKKLEKEWNLGSTPKH